MLLSGGWYQFGPTERNCRKQVDTAIVDLIASEGPLDQQPQFNRRDFWRCYGQSEKDMRRIGLSVVGDHMSELLIKGFSDAFSTP